MGSSLAYEFISEAATMGIMKLNVKTKTPVVWGFLPAMNVKQAQELAGTNQGKEPPRCNYGVEWAQEAIELAHLKRITAQIVRKKQQKSDHCHQQHCKCSCHCHKCKCGTCSCTNCQCASCSHGNPSKCHGCGKSTANCDCTDCKCISCESKAVTQSGTPDVCEHCGCAMDHCECRSSSLSPGMTTVTTKKKL